MEEQEVKTSKIKKLRKHIRENKKFYIGTATGVAMGVIGTLVYCLRTVKTNEVEVGDMSGIDSLLFVGNDNNVLYQHITKYGNKVGRRGNPVFDMTTRKTYRTEALAALDIGVTNTRMSNHVNGKTKHINGHQLIRLNEMIPDWYEEAEVLCDRCDEWLT
jgi:hypothetical protein